MPDSKPFVSIIIPCRNEAGFISACVESLDGNDYPKDRLEVLVVDGMSDDGTGAVLETLAKRYPYLRVLSNPRKTVPVAMNLGIAAAQGEIVMRIDAHYEYAANYISRLVDCLEENNADNVGGCLVMRPANKSALARAIAVGVSHPFGIGNAYYRIGASQPIQVDTVPFGCYRRDVFERIGVFDEEMTRNQDIELNRRLVRHGGKILLVPDIVLYGHARDSLRKLARMYFQYGYFNPLVIRKSRGRITSRQIVTPTFALSLMIGAVLAPWLSIARWFLAAVLGAYALPLVGYSTATAVKHGIGCGLWMLVVFPTLHLSHGLGFLKGFLDANILRRTIAKHAESISLTR
jgi:cellulose synthase/poly-beta-1,6-N-acetylglucosamine synthase-like glycosyltransferase